MTDPLTEFEILMHSAASGLHFQLILPSYNEYDQQHPPLSRRRSLAMCRAPACAVTRRQHDSAQSRRRLWLFETVVQHANSTNMSLFSLER